MLIYNHRKGLYKIGRDFAVSNPNQPKGQVSGGKTNLTYFFYSFRFIALQY